jgi:hypothetical protein
MDKKPEVPVEMLTWDQRLALFDPKLHGGEVMVTAPTGKEVV